MLTIVVGHKRSDCRVVSVRDCRDASVLLPLCDRRYDLRCSERQVGLNALHELRDRKGKIINTPLALSFKARDRVLHRRCTVQ